MKNINIEQHEKHLGGSLGSLGGKLSISVGKDYSRGKIKGKRPNSIVLRDLSGESEFIDVRGQAWSIKSFNSRFPPRNGGYSLEKAMDNIKRSLAENENIILDIYNMYTHKDELLEELSKWRNRKLMKRIYVWPRGNENIIDLLMQYQLVINLAILKDRLLRKFYRWKNRKLK